MGNSLSQRSRGSDTSTVDIVSDKPCPLKVVIISDTHNDHRSVTVPDGDVLIHGGDFTNFGSIEHAYDFNEWLGTLPHAHKIVVNGNHESNAPWKKQTKDILTNAIFLRQEAIVLHRTDASPVKFYGTDFFWPIRDGGNPYFDQIDADTDVLIAHGPVDCFMDGGYGCPALRRRCEDLKQSNLKLVIGGHIHSAYGTCGGTEGCEGVQFVNGSICGSARKACHEPIVVMI